MKKIILIGRTDSGKTTLIQVLNGYGIKYKKTQTIEYHNNILDIPGEYIENKGFYNAIITSSFDCDIIALVQACNDDGCIFPPNFALMFNKEIIGLITKIDCQDGDIEYARECLNNAGASRIFEVSSLEGNGIEDVRAYFSERNLNKNEGSPGP